MGSPADYKLLRSFVQALNRSTEHCVDCGDTEQIIFTEKKKLEEANLVHTRTVEEEKVPVTRWVWTRKAFRVAMTNSLQLPPDSYEHLEH